MKLIVPLLQLRARLQHRAGLRQTPNSHSAEAYAKLGDLITDGRTLWRIWGQAHSKLLLTRELTVFFARSFAHLPMVNIIGTKPPSYAQPTHHRASTRMVNARLLPPRTPLVSPLIRDHPLHRHLPFVFVLFQDQES